MDEQKFEFVTQGALPLFKKLSADTKAKWGKMNGQQMVEHVAVIFVGSVDKIKFTLTIPLEHLPKYKEFLYSDKQFRENTKAPVEFIGDEPIPLRYLSMNEALLKLENSIANFQKYFTEHPNKKTMHPVFGELSYDEWILFHYKHISHHLRQFGLL